VAQQVKIGRVRVHGSVFLGEIEGVDTWSSNPDTVAAWMADGWRFRFNQHRSTRKLWSPADYFDQVGNVDGRILVPLGNRITDITDITDKQARLEHSHLAALPAMVLQSPEKLESKEWFSATKRRATNLQARRPAWQMPGFRSRARSDQTFTCWFNNGKTANYQRTGRRSGVVVIAGQNPASKFGPAGKARWRIVFHVRVSENIRPYTSVQVNLTTGTLTFVNPPTPRAIRTKTGALGGIDLGVAHTVTTSDGVFFDQPDMTKLEVTRKRAQRRMAKSRLVAASEHRNFWESNRYQARKAEAAAASAKIARVRADWQHKTTAALVRDYDILGAENLNVRNMTRKSHGKNGAQKRGLNRSLAGAALAALVSKLTYKVAMNDVTVVAVNPAYTSQRCNPCGHIGKGNRESQAVFLCRECGHADNADINAARNIRDDALVIAGIADAVNRSGQGLARSQNKPKPGSPGAAQAKKRELPPIAERR
jgi:putative transposase